MSLLVKTTSVLMQRSLTDKIEFVCFEIHSLKLSVAVSTLFFRRRVSSSSFICFTSRLEKCPSKNVNIFIFFYVRWIFEFRGSNFYRRESDRFQRKFHGDRSNHNRSEFVHNYFFDCKIRFSRQRNGDSSIGLDHRRSRADLHRWRKYFRREFDNSQSVRSTKKKMKNFFLSFRREIRQTISRKETIRSSWLSDLTIILKSVPNRQRSRSAITTRFEQKVKFSTKISLIFISNKFNEARLAASVQLTNGCVIGEMCSLMTNEVLPENTIVLNADGNRRLMAPPTDHVKRIFSFFFRQENKDRSFFCFRPSTTRSDIIKRIFGELNMFFQMEAQRCNKKKFLSHDWRPRLSR